MIPNPLCLTAQWVFFAINLEHLFDFLKKVCYTPIKHMFFYAEKGVIT